MLGSSIVKLITLEEPASIHTEMYRSIRTNIEYSSVDKQLKVINITSTFSDEAKTTSTCNIAIMAANKHKNVLLIDLDLRSPSIHRAFNIKNEFGITDMLIDFLKNGENIDIQKYIQLIKHDNISNNFYVLPAGTDVINPSEILSSKKIRELINLLKQHYDEIYIDSAPSGVVTDGIITSTFADGTLFLVESGKTKIDAAQKVIKSMKDINVNILGVILTKVPNRMTNYGYGYGNMDKNNKRIKIDLE